MTAIHIFKGADFGNKGMLNEVIAEFTRALEINPRYADAYTNRGLAYFVGLGNKVKGCADFRKACELGECGNYNIAKQRGDCL